MAASFSCHCEERRKPVADRDWDCFNPPIGYGENFRYTAERDGRYHHVSIYRDERGQYERPVHYDAGAIR